MFNQNLQLLNVHEYSINKIKNLCSCVFCWDSKDTERCVKCKKKYCKFHRENHLCFIESEVWN